MIPDRRNIAVLKTDRCGRRLAFDHQQLREALPREGGPQFEGDHQLLKPTRQIIER